MDSMPRRWSTTVQPSRRDDRVVPTADASLWPPVDTLLAMDISMHLLATGRAAEPPANETAEPRELVVVQAVDSNTLPLERMAGIHLPQYGTSILVDAFVQGIV
ncbi:hypothetical protein LSAT2_032777 [Lamellibrachia satsuma]|nr:hypothetical protein LSAT2_032777 [Lamellibrachia satsuma]